MEKLQKSQEGQGIAAKLFKGLKTAKKSLKGKETVESSINARSCRKVPSKEGNYPAHVVCMAWWSGTHIASLKQCALSWARIMGILENDRNTQKGYKLVEAWQDPSKVPSPSNGDDDHKANTMD
ncbi:hypothetical protein Taro_024558 [Colocasia esculenta]|uniref:Uncharacterized protein n=1 Tax=Colocasia esculenta TaxID=4460 RepID=A0A843VE02_COLES|nr:hypothetical protein [Colocasia esculenta]